jgi:uncharacterized protein YbjT (DUF2867 family)
VRGVSRSGDAAGLPEGVLPVTADLRDASALKAAYSGADAVVLHLPLVFQPSIAAEMIAATLDATQSAGVAHLVFNASSLVPPEPVGVPGIDLRVDAIRAVEAAPLRTTVLQPTLYMENLSGPWSPIVAGEGAIRYPLPAAAPVAWVSVSDVACFAAVALDRCDGLTGSYVLPGPEELTGHDVARELSTALGREVVWEQVEPERYADMLRPHLGAEVAAGVAGVYEAAANLPPAPAPDPGPALRAVPFERTRLSAWAAAQDWR